MTDPRSFAVCMGMDAFRICIGMRPTNFTAPEVLRWMQTMLRGPRPAKTHTEEGAKP